MRRLDMPACAVEREVGRVCTRSDEHKSDTGDIFDHIEVAWRPGDDVSSGPIGGDDLFRVAAEGKNAQWDTVIIDPVAAADYRHVFLEGLPGKTCSRSKPEGMRKILALRAYTKIEC